jgi:hypothetical protein
MMVHLSVYTTPKVRLYFPDSEALCQSFTEEFIRLIELPTDNPTPGFSYANHFEAAAKGALSTLHLPLEMEMETPAPGVMVITLHLNSLLGSKTPSGSVH